MKRLIVTGDDFGLSLEVNRGIEQAHQAGILTTASLIVGAPCTSDAIKRARRLPNLNVGLHIVVVRGTPVLAPGQLTAITNNRGRFIDNLFEAGVRFHFSPRAAGQLLAEIRSQFEAFKRSGLELDHVNAHHHMHVHPTVLGAIVAIGKEHNLKAVRLPLEPSLTVRPARLQQLIETVCLEPWLRRMSMQLRQAEIFTNDFLFGRRDYPNMSRANVMSLLSQLPHGTTEMCFHPTMKYIGNSGGYYANEDLKTLISNDIAQALIRLGVEQTSFAALS